MTDEDMAKAIREKAQELRDAVKIAKDAGLTVDPPLMLQNWLITGFPPGEPAAWTIRRRSL